MSKHFPHSFLANHHKEGLCSKRSHFLIVQVCWWWRWCEWSI